MLLYNLKDQRREGSHLWMLSSLGPNFDFSIQMWPYRSWGVDACRRELFPHE